MLSYEAQRNDIIGSRKLTDPGGSNDAIRRVDRANVRCLFSVGLPVWLSWDRSCVLAVRSCAVIAHF